jgi:hypothetical protein
MTLGQGNWLGWRRLPPPPAPTVEGRSVAEEPLTPLGNLVPGVVPGQLLSCLGPHCLQVHADRVGERAGRRKLRIVAAMTRAGAIAGAI